MYEDAQKSESHLLLLQPQVSHVRRAEVMMDIHLEKALFFFFNC